MSPQALISFLLVTKCLLSRGSTILIALLHKQFIQNNFYEIANGRYEEKVGVIEQNSLNGNAQKKNNKSLQVRHVAI